MSQTVTCEIELDALPRLEHGSSLLHVKSLQAQTPDALTENLNGEYFSGETTSNYAKTMNSGHTLVSPDQVKDTVRLRIGNILIEDKALYLAGACMGSFVAGLNFTATGANLPSFQDHYHLSYETVSLVFLTGFGGFVCVKFRSAKRDWNIQCSTGFYEACLTSVISHFEDGRLMNIIYAFAGLGALVSPFVIGALTKANASWKLYYWFPLSLTILFAICHYMLFKNYVIPADHEEAPENKSVRARFKLVMRMPMTWLGMILMVLSYAIVDVLSNWLTSYLIDVKGTAPDVSRYQLAMFWAGLTAGRIFFSLPLIHLRERMGNALLLVSMCGAIGLLWAVRSTASDWIAVAVAGFFLGPNTPGILSIISTRVPPSLKGIVVSITIGSALVGGTLGSLIFGVTVGKVSPGLRMLGPFIMVLAGLSALLFWGIPPRRKVD
ncbi:MFS transporter [Rhizoctonia solani 123E]|uniref:MFS transporter n=1 Tax=Rhizoctonia solani 123E TaxID=1423351 RepID=A0A074RY64_9AGAM|nr:MFS transporter [Rhizoctonia solani 123E]